MSAFQVSGRNLFLWVLIGNEERMQTQPFVFYLFMTYSSIEVFRCAYYFVLSSKTIWQFVLFLGIPTIFSASTTKVKPCWHGFGNPCLRSWEIYWRSRSGAQVLLVDPSLPSWVCLWGCHCLQKHCLPGGNSKVTNGSNIISRWCQKHVRATILLPNSWNIAFHLPNIIRFYLLFGFFPMLYNQMCHMYNLRLELK